MPKPKSTHKTKDMIQTTVWLPHGMYGKLTKGGQLKLADEIRRRLQASFDAEQLPSDQKTEELLDAIKQIKGNLDELWHTDRFAYDVFKAAINELLSNYQPSSETQPRTVSKLQTMYGPDVNPVTIGNILAHVAIKELEKERAKQSFVDKQKG